MTTAAAPLKSATTSHASGRVFNFSAGPGVLPEEVLRQVQEDVWNIRGSGIGILEHSHRGPVFDKILAEAIADCKAVGNIPDAYQVLFLTGGASAQNWMIPANFLPQGGTADYADVGHWAKRSLEDAKFYGNIHTAMSSEASNHNHIPTQDQIKFSDKPAYFHYTSNNTIFGTQFHYVPKTPAGVPLVCDMCSDIYSRPVDIAKFDLIYAGAQKNLGPAGTTVVIIKDELVEKGSKTIHPWHQYRTFAKGESRPNTPPVFPIYVVGQVFKWIEKNGGLAAMAKHNDEKAKIVYDVLDKSSFYTGHAQKGSRSLMNITFRTPNEELDKKFCKEAEKAGLDGLKGHRSVGGMRASTYNAMPKEGAKALAQFMQEFERTNG